MPLLLHLPPSSVFLPSASTTSFPSPSLPPLWLISSSMQLHSSPLFAPPNSCNSDHTHTHKYLPMHSHVAVLERFPPQKSGRLIKTQIKPQNFMCSHWCGDLLLGHTFTSCSPMGKAHDFGEIPKIQSCTQVSSCPRPLYFGNVPPWGFTLHKNMQTFIAQLALGELHRH
jgi:hypothetical protein